MYFPEILYSRLVLVVFLSGFLDCKIRKECPFGKVSSWVSSSKGEKNAITFVIEIQYMFLMIVSCCNLFREKQDINLSN